MKVEIKESNQVKERPFPKLMKGTMENELILMTKSGTGMAISGCRVGYRSDCWHMASFKDFEGSITLSNE